jgi:ADP-ribosylglycohydrolase
MLYPTPTIIGAIAGDIIGSVFERNNVKTAKFPLFSDKSDFTDDTVLTVAVADAILHDKDFCRNYLEIWTEASLPGVWRLFYRMAAIGKPCTIRKLRKRFGDARESLGFAFDTLEEVLRWPGDQQK